MNAKDSILNNYKVLSKPSKAVADIVLGKSEAKENSRSLFNEYESFYFSAKDLLYELIRSSKTVFLQWRCIYCFGTG